MRLLLFNPENDLALASNDAHYTPPASALKMAADLQRLPQIWAEPDDIILLRDSETSFIPSCMEPRREILPWGWSPLLVRQLKELGVPKDLLPTKEQISSYRSFSSRQKAVELLRRLRQEWSEPFECGVLVGESIWCSSEYEVLHAVDKYDGRAMLKAPWSSSGRGVHPVQHTVNEKTISWINSTLQRQGGVEVEPLYNKVQDFALEFWSDHGNVRYEGLSLFNTTAGGVYAGNLVASEEEKESRLATYISSVQLHDVKEHLTELLNSAGVPQWYNGPLGVDLMITDCALHPLVEINLRMTMGWVALKLIPKLQYGETAAFSIVQQAGHYQVLFNKQRT